MFSKNVRNLALECVDTVAFEILAADSDKRVREIMWELKLFVAGTVSKSTILSPDDVKGFKAAACERISPYLKDYFTKAYDGKEQQPPGDLKQLWESTTMFETTNGSFDYEWDKTFRTLFQ